MITASLANNERRHHRRVSHNLSVQAHTPTGQAITLDVIDYSLGGMCLVSRSPYEVGETLEFDYLLGLDGAQRKLGLAGEVCYVQEQFQEYGIGIRFL
jgi:PilZ domain